MNWQHCWRPSGVPSLLVTNIATRWVINGEPCRRREGLDCVRGHHHRRNLAGVPEANAPRPLK